MAKFLDDNGLLYFWQKIKAIFAKQTDLTALSNRVDDIVETGGEPNVIETVKVNGTALTPDANKAVNVTVVEGTTNGTIKVNDVAVNIHGLGTAAYTASTAYDASGAAAAVLGTSSDASTANTVYGAKALANSALTAIAGMDSSIAAETNKAIASVTITDGKITAHTKATIPTNNNQLTNGAGYQTATNVSSAITTAIAALDSSITAETNKAIASVTIVDGKITGNTKITVPTNNNQLTNGAGYQTAQDVSDAISGSAASSDVYKYDPDFGKATIDAYAVDVSSTDTVNITASSGDIVLNPDTTNSHNAYVGSDIIATQPYVTTAISGKANLASPAFTGTPTAPTATAGTNTTQIATTAFVTTAVSGKANTASPAFTGTPTAPTAAAGTNTTQIATTAFVKTAVEAAQVGAATFQGTVNTGTDISGLATYKKGYYWVVATAGTYVGQTCEVGDMIFAVKDKGSAYSASDFSVVQNNIVTITNAEIDTILAA